MKLASIAISALAMLAVAPQAIAKRVYHVDVSVNFNDTRIVSGAMYLSEEGARTYGGDLFDRAPPLLLREGAAGNVRSGSVVGAAIGSADGSAISAAGEGVSASEIAVGRNQEIELPANPIDSNRHREVAYDLMEKLRIEIDHDLRILRTHQLIISNENIGKMTVFGAPEGARPDQLGALNNLLRGFGRPRLDPKKEIKIVMDPDSDFAIVNGQAVDCRWATLNRMGGPFARACLADPDSLPDGREFIALLRELPLEGAGEDDLVGRMRQIAETDKVPVKFEDERSELPLTINAITDISDADDTAIDAQLAVTQRKILEVLSEYERR